jgi:hypothetical protein
MYIGSGKTEDVISGKYKGSVLSKEYKAIFNRLKKEQPHLIHSEIIHQFESRDAAYEEEIKLHAKYDVARCPVFMNKAMATTTGFSCVGHSQETRMKISNSGYKRYNENPEARIKTSEAQIKRFSKPEERIKHSDCQKKRFSNPEEIKKKSEEQKKRYENPEERIKMREIILNKPVIVCPHCGKEYKFPKNLHKHLNNH